MLTDEKIRQVIVDSRGRLNMYSFADVVYIARVIESAVREECVALRDRPVWGSTYGEAYRDGWIDSTKAYQLAIAIQGEPK